MTTLAASIDAVHYATAPTADTLPAREVMGVWIHAPSLQSAARRIVSWARAGAARTVYATSAHGLVEAQHDPSLRAVLNRADLNVPDGTPLVWTLRALGVRNATRVYGPDLTVEVCRAAATAGVSVALYGSTPATLARLKDRLLRLAPGLDIACAIAPPFGRISPADDASHVARLVESGAGIVLVGLGCPRQERWCDEHRHRLPAVLIGVGAAFDFHAGTVRQAPSFVQRAGLEWAFRLGVEPRRLWRRYARVVPHFFSGAIVEIARARM
jgi:N-acetylglucosaminyldiphosphoundecaprenol N-acetyl-beta-D-mannosaminyltransferase